MLALSQFTVAQTRIYKWMRRQSIEFHMRIVFLIEIQKYKQNE